jgi:WD40 repeat protein
MVGLALWNLETGAQVRFPDPASGQEQDRFGWHPDRTLWAVVFTPDGRQAVSAGGDLRLWDLASGLEVRRFPEESATCLALSGDGRLALSGRGDGLLKLWDVSTGKEVRSFVGHQQAVSSVAFTPDGKLAVSVSGDKTMRIWEVATGKELRTCTGHTHDLLTVAVSPDGKLAVSAGNERRLKIWSLPDGRLVRDISVGGRDVYWATGAVFSPDGLHLFATGGGGVRVWEVATGNEILDFMVPSAPDGLAMTPDGKRVLVCSSLDLVLFDASSGEEFRTLAGFPADGPAISYAAFALDGKRIMAQYGWHGELKVWDLDRGQVVHAFKKLGRNLTSVALCPDGKQALIVESDGRHLVAGYKPEPDELVLWDLSAGQVVRSFEPPRGWISCVTFSPDGRLALTASNPDKPDVHSGSSLLQLWDVATGRVVRTFGAREDPVWQLRLTSDGKEALAAGKSLTAWQLGTGELLRAFEGPGDDAWPTFSPDGRLALSKGNALKLWDTKTGQVIRTLMTAGVDDKGSWRGAFSPDSSLLLGGRNDATLFLWDVRSGEQLRLFVGQGFPEELTSLAFSADGKKALSGAGGQSLKVWDVATGRQIRRLDTPPEQ